MTPLKLFGVTKLTPPVTTTFTTLHEPCAEQEREDRTLVVVERTATKTGRTKLLDVCARCGAA